MKSECPSLPLSFLIYPAKTLALTRALRSPNTGKAMFESKFIIEYLEATYAVAE